MAHIRKFDTGAVRDVGGKPNIASYSDPLVEWRFARYMQNSEKKYGRGNWKKGIPKEEYLESMMRHVFKLWVEVEYGGKTPLKWTEKLEQWLGPLDELEIGYDHASGVRFNINGFMREQIKDELK